MQDHVIERLMMDEPTHQRRICSNRLAMDFKSDGQNQSLREGDVLLAKEETKYISAQEKTHLELTVTITSKYVQQIIEEGVN